MKNTMSGRNIAKFHKMLAQDISIDKISKFLGISKSALKKFMPDIMDAVNKAKRLAAVESLKKPETVKVQVIPAAEVEAAKVVSETTEVPPEDVKVAAKPPAKAPAKAKG